MTAAAMPERAAHHLRLEDMTRHSVTWTFIVLRIRVPCTRALCCHKMGAPIPGGHGCWSVLSRGKCQALHFTDSLNGRLGSSSLCLGYHSTLPRLHHNPVPGRWGPQASVKSRIQTRRQSG